MNAQTPPPALKVAAEPAANQTQLPPPRRKRRWKLLLLLIPVLGLAVAAPWYLRVARFMQSTDNAYIQGDIAVLGSRIEGDVTEILVGDNQPVTAGQPLIRLDDRDWKARRDAAAADLEQAEAAIATTRAQIDQQQAQIAAAAAQVTQAEAERIRATADQRRTGTLAGGGWASREQADRTTADARKAEASVTAAQASLAAQRAALPVMQAQVSQAEARRDSARAALTLAESNLDYTLIRAPFDGLAGNRAAQLGQHVRQGQNLIAVAPPPQRQYIVANYKETQLTRMRIGQPVYVTVDALPGLELHGRIDSLAPATGAQFSLLPPENATGNFTKIVQRVPVRIAIDTARAGERMALLRPGLSVEAEVDTRDDPEAPRGLFGAAAAALSGR
jgi:membrane fusion protein (multidrug efflux system)